MWYKTIIEGQWFACEFNEIDIMGPFPCIVTQKNVLVEINSEIVKIDYIFFKRCLCIVNEFGPRFYYKNNLITGHKKFHNLVNNKKNWASI